MTLQERKGASCVSSHARENILAHAQVCPQAFSVHFVLIIRGCLQALRFMHTGDWATPPTHTYSRGMLLVWFVSNRFKHMCFHGSQADTQAMKQLSLPPNLTNPNLPGSLFKRQSNVKHMLKWLHFPCTCAHGSAGSTGGSEVNQSDER